jgi:hypothetical protein
MHLRRLNGYYWSAFAPEEGGMSRRSLIGRRGETGRLGRLLGASVLAEFPSLSQSRPWSLL